MAPWECNVAHQHFGRTPVVAMASAFLNDTELPLSLSLEPVVQDSMHLMAHAGETPCISWPMQVRQSLYYYITRMRN